jgi:hypothetical protein
MTVFGRAPIMGPIRRSMLATEVTTTAPAIAPHVFAQQAEQGGTVMSFYDRGLHPL